MTVIDHHPGVMTGPQRRTAALRVLMTTEGTYPYVVGGVSTWADHLLRAMPDVAWSILPIAAGPQQRLAYDLPAGSRVVGPAEVWDAGAPSARRPRALSRLRSAARPDLPSALVRCLLSWDADPTSVVPELVWCRDHPEWVGESFRHRRAFSRFLQALGEVVEEPVEDLAPGLRFDVARAVQLFHTLRWLASVATVPTPEVDVVHVTAAGWAAVPALVDKAVHGTPVLLTEHGLYVREAYLAAVRGGDDSAGRFLSTRLARGLTRSCYAAADLVSPVCQAHRAWEEHLGVPADRVVPIPNGVPAPAQFTPAPRNRVVVSVGRLDPLKDIRTMLRVADAVLRQDPSVEFRHYGPVSDGQEGYAEGCRRLHDELRLGESFRFCGPTKDPTGVMRDADIVLMTSISEGFPMSVLEAMSQGRPVVTTAVGGVEEAMTGAGLTAPTGDVQALAEAVLTLLQEHWLADKLAARGHARVARLFPMGRVTDGYRAAYARLLGAPA